MFIFNSFDKNTHELQLVSHSFHSLQIIFININLFQTFEHGDYENQQHKDYLPDQKMLYLLDNAVDGTVVWVHFHQQ